jgi:hypothetical protein
MIKWEYVTVVVDTDIPNSIPNLDAAGAEGWEVIHVQQTAFDITYLLKRPLPMTEAGVGIKHDHSSRFMCNRSCPHYGTVNEITG